jgi:acetyl-CoA acetyltransferase
VSRREVAIVGVAESDLGVTNKSRLALSAQAVMRACDDAGVAVRDLDGVFTNNASRFSTTLLSEYLGIAPRWTDSTFVGGSAFEAYTAKATEAIAAGVIDTAVIAYGSDQRSAKSRTLGGTVEDWTPAAQYETPHGPMYPASLYAMAATRHFHEHGTTEEDLAAIAVAAREWALLNPAAYRHDAGPLTVADVLASPPVSTPLKVADCCLVTDGGGAIVLTSLDRARDLTDAPVVVLGHGEATTHDTMAQMPDLTSTGAVASGRRAFAMAGVTAGDVHVAQLYDSFTITVALTLEALGFCDAGGFAELVADGGIAPNGRLPVNTSGGGLSYCHPGQFGILLLVEAVRQLRGQCGDRQVAGAEVAVAHGTGGILSHHATVVLGRDR